MWPGNLFPEFRERGLVIRFVEAYIYTCGDEGKDQTVKGKIMARIEFHSDRFEFAHGRKPKGRGGWAFHPDFNVDACDKSIIWVQGTFAEAKAQARKVAAERGWSDLEVLS